MEDKLEKHPVYKLNTDGVDFSNFRVLLVYANSPMDNLFPVGISSIAGMLKKHKIVRNKLFPNQLSDIEFKRLRLLDQNIELTDKQFSEKLNKSRYLTNKGNKWTATSAFNVKRKLGLGSLGPRTFITDE